MKYLKLYEASNNTDEIVKTIKEILYELDEEQIRIFKKIDKGSFKCDMIIVNQIGEVVK